MSDQLTRARPRGSRLREPAIILALFAVAGVLAGVLWAWWWPEPTGIVGNGTVLLDGDGQRAAFSGTGGYVLGAVALGLVLSVVSCIVFERDEVVTLAAVVGGSVLAGAVMMWVGGLVGPPDPVPLARTMEDYAEVPLNLTVPPAALIAAPTGAVTGALVVLLGITRRDSRRSRSRPPT